MAAAPLNARRPDTVPQPPTRAQAAVPLFSRFFVDRRRHQARRQAERGLAFGGWLSYRSGWLLDTFGIGAMDMPHLTRARKIAERARRARVP